jgi:phosphate-selective porin OprO/OprP
MSLHPATKLGVSLLAVAAVAGALPASARPKAARSDALRAQIAAEAQRLIDLQKQRYDEDSAQKQAQIDALQAEVKDLASQLKAVQDKQAATPPVPTVQQVAQAVTAAQPKPATTTTIKAGTTTIASSDGDFSIAFKGVFQMDAATYSQDKNLDPAVTARDLNSGTNFRRARLGVTGKLFHDFDYMILTDFGGAGAEDVGRFHEAWIQYSGLKSAKLRIGEFAPNVGLADAGSTNSSPFLERPSAAEVARSLTAGDTRMAVAAFNGGDRLLWSFAITGNTVSTLNTQASGFTAPNADEQLGIAARIAGTPFKGKDWLIHVGANYSAVINPGDAGAAAATRYPVQLRDRPELRVDGTRLIDTGAINAQSATETGVELAWQNGPLFMQGEAFDFDIRRKDPLAGATDPSFSGWYVEGGWSLTGEARKYNTMTAAFDGVAPAHNFDPKAGHWGAWELVARYSTLDLNYHENAATAADRVRGGRQDVTALGLGWQLDPSIRFVFQGQDVRVVRMNAAGGLMDQRYHTFAVRSQFGF